MNSGMTEENGNPNQVQKALEIIETKSLSEKELINLYKKRFTYFCDKGISYTTNNYRIIN